mmetsp:Transcript_17873/g.62710  ORF Transcript_17873/g.62710 Transcript_17873/m.62710 type:complete len:204 (-) Transcript_17873:634-1245(-)
MRLPDDPNNWRTACKLASVRSARLAPEMKGVAIPFEGQPVATRALACIRRLRAPPVDDRERGTEMKNGHPGRNPMLGEQRPLFQPVDVRPITGLPVFTTSILFASVILLGRNDLRCLGLLPLRRDGCRATRVIDRNGHWCHCHLLGRDAIHCLALLPIRRHGCRAARAINRHGHWCLCHLIVQHDLPWNSELQHIPAITIRAS